MAILLSELVARFGGRVVGEGDPSIRAVASLSAATAESLVFLQSAKHKAGLANCNAAAVVLSEGNEDLTTLLRWVVPSDARYYFIQAAQLLHPPPQAPAGVAPSAVVAESATLGKGVHIAPNVVVADNAVIGDGVCIQAGCVVCADVSIGAQSILFPNVMLYPKTQIGERAILHAGVVIGADGFGYAQDSQAAAGNQKFPHLGRVRIGDDVEVGANSCIDRGTLDDTIIANHVKIDNQVQIGHNVVIGDNTIICGKVGIAGSATIGKNCMIGGGVGIAGHIRLADGVMVAGGSNVTRSLGAGVYSSVWSAQPIAQWRRFVGFLRQQHKKR